ncbi:phenylacetate--CoA ligase family protein [Evansella halocellulosilytica]|uniref:phenylacetate--CoA ligase family protein n=1 Tax=Evansella halocellulosilytica TaxID=2011013 RepID=UPI000BB96939|nr:phenylacetate--CoA ligase family protein [Evansella halocellulosilytica]
MSESTFKLWLDARKVRKQGMEAVKQRQRDRLKEMVNFARVNSNFYRDKYKNLPDNIENPTSLPITNKKMLMNCFDDWVTDPKITLEHARSFMNNSDLVGEKFQGKYLLATTSGTSGNRGIFVMDERSQAVNVALGIIRAQSWYGAGDRARMLARGGRQAFIMATGGHFVGVAGASQIIKSNRLANKTMKIFSVHKALPELVAELNDYQPTMILGYASVVSLLASEQEAGRLKINPVLVQPGGESLPESEFERIAKAFKAKVRTAYSATECAFMASSCEHGWLHIDSDWVILEPVDADYKPTPVGEQSHTVLLSNLANRIQPVLRYDLGDSILTRPEPCPCGNPLPAIRINGRSNDVLTFSTAEGEEVTITPLAFGTLFDRTPGIDLFQIVHIEPTTIKVRLQLSDYTNTEKVWQSIHAELSHLFTENEINHIKIERATEPPEQSSGGKYRTIIPLESTTSS